MRITAWQSVQIGLGGLRLDTVDLPEPGLHQALVEVDTAAVNFSDLLMIDDAYQVRPTRPFVPGQEIAGTVLASGPQSALEPGQRVASKLLWGGFASHSLVRDDMAFMIPKGVSLSEAAVLPVVYTTAMVALTESTQLRPGERVLIHAAAGGVGLASLQVARALGAEVIATAGTRAKRDLARQQGAAHVVDYTQPDWAGAVRERSGGRGVDVVVDPVGGEVTGQSLRCMVWKGRLLIVGFASGTIPKLPAHRLLLRRLSAIGVNWDHDRDGVMLATISRRLVKMLEAGEISPLVQLRRGLEQVPEALEAVRDRRSCGKIVIQVRNRNQALRQTSSS